MQGDRKAGPSLSEFNYESVWGQSALKRTYRAILEEEAARVVPPACLPAADGLSPGLDVRTFWGLARAHLLNVGIIRPGPSVTAIEVRWPYIPRCNLQMIQLLLQVHRGLFRTTGGC